MDNIPVKVNSTANRSPASRGRVPKAPDPKSHKGIVVTSVIIMAIILTVLGTWLAWRASNTSTVIETDTYQAVFFTNGQVYFGKLQKVDSDYMKLTDVYYIQSGGDQDTENPQKKTDDTSGLQLIKLGSEVHGPKDAMIIIKDQLLFFENLKPDGKVARSISQYQQQQ